MPERGLKAEVGRLIAAIIVAEGGTPDALVRAIRFSFPNTRNFAEAYAITYNTVIHWAWRYAMQSPVDFIQYLGSHPDPQDPSRNTGWAPVGAANDPKHLNENWPRNVYEAWKVQE